MTIADALFSSAKQNWETPQWLFDELNEEFGFELDAAADESNCKCPHFLSEGDDALCFSWADLVSSVWLNPPYGRGAGEWVRKAHEESQRGATVVCLLPARTDTAWFHDHVYGRADIRFLRGRLKFVGATSPAPFPSMIVVFRPPEEAR